MHKFYGVLYGDYVSLPYLVYVIKHRGEGGGFTAACGAGYQHKSFRFLTQFFKKFDGKPQFFKWPYLPGNTPQCRRYRPPLHIDICAESPQPRYAK